MTCRNYAAVSRVPRKLFDARRAIIFPSISLSSSANLPPDTSAVPTITNHCQDAPSQTFTAQTRVHLTLSDSAKTIARSARRRDLAASLIGQDQKPPRDLGRPMRSLALLCSLTRTRLNGTGTGPMSTIKGCHWLRAKLDSSAGEACHGCQVPVGLHCKSRH